MDGEGRSPGLAGGALTIGALWHDIAGRRLGDELLEWAPDLVAFTDVVLARSEAYRFAVSPPEGSSWPPPEMSDWPQAIADASAGWSAWVDGDGIELPGLVAEEWAVVCERSATSLDELATGRAWRICQALITLHAIADEACAGTGVTVAGISRDGARFRARARELLARTGSLSRISRQRLRVLPCVRNPVGGPSIRSLSRYVCVRGPEVDVVWNRIPAGTVAPGGPAQEGNVLMLPWPLRIDAEDFKPAGAVKRAGLEPYGFFEFAPGELLDLDLADRVLQSARNQQGSVDIVVLPESELRPGDIDELEALLTRHRVWLVVAGVREPPGPGARFGGNWLHLGVWLGGRWWRYRQNKHHRWSLDDKQIEQYHLAAALPLAVRWWEAMAVPRRAVQVVELDEGVTLVSLVCEDLARLDEVADLLRAIGPTLVVTTLLDGPQLASRWTARYASVLADDPGSAVVTLTSFGFVQRSLPPGLPPSRVVSLWKDPVRGLREIPLDVDAHAVLIRIQVGRTTRHSADGRLPVANTANVSAEGVRQIRALDLGDHTGVAMPEAPVDNETAVSLEAVELTILTCWAEAVAEALAASPDQLKPILGDARAGAPWRRQLGVAEPSADLASALEDLTRVVSGTPTVEAVLAAMDERPRGGDYSHLVRAILRSKLGRRGQGG
ncbi:MAG TPA: hypothetical protein VKK19_04480 [Candidatus Dormibacteraeota bacterium]|nr:hypothetical protein [Candidatus Dormibacteraeota bacterium]